MSVIIKNGTLLTGRLDSRGELEAVPNTRIVIDGDRITSITEGRSRSVRRPAKGDTVINARGKYILPGLINMHVHLVPKSKLRKGKTTDYHKLMDLLQNHPMIMKGFEKLIEAQARQFLYSGTTTIRTVGGLEDKDARLRDKINRGEVVGPRILACNTAVSVPNGHFAGLIGTEAKDAAEAASDVERIALTGPDWIKLMITGGVLDATETGEPGVLRMMPELVRTACDKAHGLGYRVAAHVESPEGVRVALENGVDTIEHGAAPDDEIIRLFRERGAADICTISPAIPFREVEAFRECYGEVGYTNGSIVAEGIVECAKKCLANDIPVGLGTDVGCPYVLPYDMWREIAYFAKYCEVSSDFAIHTATMVNAEILGLADQIGSIEPGKVADILIVSDDPRSDLSALAKPYAVIGQGKVHRRPRIRKDKKIEEALDAIL